MRGRKLLALLAVIFVFLSYIGAAGAYNFAINSRNSVIVLPTTKIVNGTPLHIGEDAISGSRLGAFLVLKGIRTSYYTDKVKVPVEYHSVLIEDNDQYYKLNKIDMPDLSLNVSDSPTGKAVVVAVNFSKISYNSTSKKAHFEDRSIEIIFNENTTPLELGGKNTITVATQVNGKDVMYIYNFEEKDDTAGFGATISINGWSITFQDIDVNQETTFTQIQEPDGNFFKKILEKGKYYLFYEDKNGNLDREEFASYPSSRLSELQEEGAKKIFLFSPTGFFIGIGGIKQVQYSYEYYEKLKEYRDGDVYQGQWVWDIDPDSNLFTIYLHVDPENGFNKVELGENMWVVLPVGNLKLHPIFTKDDKGKITGIEAYQFVQTETVESRVQVQTTSADVVDDVHDLIITDEELTSLPDDKNVIIVGGWVSNKAWSLLEQVYGKSTIQNIKDDIMSKGHVVKILNNPENSNYKVIILAGKGYPETAQAIEEFMSNA